MSVAFMVYYTCMEKKLWFKAKRFGWGWTPCTWQGWAILVLYFVGLVPIFIFGDAQPKSFFEVLRLFPQVLVLTIFLIIICYVTGEKPRWRWGE